MKRIEIDAELYRHIASHTQFIGESASDILRRLLGLNPLTEPDKPKVVAKGTEAKVTEPTKTALEAVVKGELTAQKGKVGRFLYLLSVLYQCHPQQFENVLRIRGRNRLYFATCEEELKASGNSTNPKEVPGSGYWVITNSNTSKKQAMLKRAAQELGYTLSEAEKLRDLL
ncbi:MAG TPA: replication initiation negative regulator SeqA [Aliidiomarina sp.]|nr:replication initiation negative regulator SeqA [Aliidiomarina sp.]